MTAALPAFDTLLEMAREDPEALERLRRRLCEEVIRRTPDASRAERLRRLLWRIDGECRRARTPMGACLRMSTLMIDALHRLDAAFNAPYPPEPARAARILPFASPGAGPVS
jgi:hypothetical protein